MQPKRQQSQPSKVEVTLQTPHELARIDSVVIDFIRKFEQFDKKSDDLAIFFFSYADALIPALQKSAYG